MAQDTVTASELKANSGRVLARVVRSRSPVTITKRGRPIARLVPVEEAPATLFGVLHGSVTILGDIIEPIDGPWDAAR